MIALATVIIVSIAGFLTKMINNLITIQYGSSIGSPDVGQKMDLEEFY